MAASWGLGLEPGCLRVVGAAPAIGETGSGWAPRASGVGGAKLRDPVHALPPSGRDPAAGSAPRRGAAPSLRVARGEQEAGGAGAWVRGRGSNSSWDLGQAGKGLLGSGRGQLCTGRGPEPALPLTRGQPCSAHRGGSHARATLRPSNSSATGPTGECWVLCGPVSQMAAGRLRPGHSPWVEDSLGWEVETRTPGQVAARWGWALCGSPAPAPARGLVPPGRPVSHLPPPRTRPQPPPCH